MGLHQEYYRLEKFTYGRPAVTRIRNIGLPRSLRHRYWHQCYLKSFLQLREIQQHKKCVFSKTKTEHPDMESISLPHDGETDVLTTGPCSFTLSMFRAQWLYVRVHNHVVRVRFRTGLCIVYHE